MWKIHVSRPSLNNVWSQRIREFFSLLVHWLLTVLLVLHTIEQKCPYKMLLNKKSIYERLNRIQIDFKTIFIYNFFFEESAYEPSAIICNIKNCRFHFCMLKKPIAFYCISILFIWLNFGLRFMKEGQKIMHSVSCSLEQLNSFLHVSFTTAKYV